MRLVFPPRCLLCAALLPPPGELPLCRRCLATYSPAGLICPQCGQVYAVRESCSCAASLPLQGLFALSWYEGEWRRMLHRLKFRGQRSLARPLGRWLGAALAAKCTWNLDLVIPVPLHSGRERERGYNQSRLIAAHAARMLDLPLAPRLRKIKPTPSQTGLPRLDRRLNVAGAFVYRGPEGRGQTVLLVDDIYSTGATLGEAARVLRRCGYKVFGAVAAYNRLLC